MGRIQRYAEGFLSLVGNKVGGREPTELSDVVLPTVDMTQLLLGRTLATEGGIGLAMGVGDTITIEVPDNEVWLLHQVSYEYAATTNTDRANGKFYLTHLPQSSDPINEIIIAAWDSPVNAAANVHEKQRSQYFATPWVLTAGVDIVFEMTDETTNPTVAAKVGFYRLTA